MNPDSMQITDSNGGSRRSYGRAGMLGLLLLLGSCVNPPAVDEAGVVQECVYERVTGSNLPVRVCRSTEERAALAAREREGAEQGLENLQDLDEFGVEAAGADSLP